MWKGKGWGGEKEDGVVRVKKRGTERKGEKGKKKGRVGNIGDEMEGGKREGRVWKTRSMGEMKRKGVLWGVWDRRRDGREGVWKRKGS